MVGKSRLNFAGAPAVSFDKGGSGSVLIGQAWHGKRTEGFNFRVPQAKWASDDGTLPDPTLGVD